MSEHQIRQLGETSKQILRFLRDSIGAIQGSLKNLHGLPDFFKNVLNRISESADRQIQAAGEMEIIKKMANLESKKYLVNAEAEAIQDFKKQLKEDVDYIKKQYTKIDNDLNKEAKTRIRTLDEHLLQLPDEYPQVFIKGYADKIAPSILKMRLDNDLSKTERKLLINDTINEAIKSFNEFIKNRNDFFIKVNGYQQDERLEKNENYNLPLTIIEKDGKNYAFLPGEIKISNKILGVRSTYRPDELLSNYYSNVKDKVDSIKPKVDEFSWNYSKKESDFLENKLLSFANKHFSNNTYNIKRAVKEIIKNSNVQSLN